MIKILDIQQWSDNINILVYLFQVTPIIQLNSHIYSKPRLKGTLKNRQNKGLNDKL